jgi:hypothetical protein
MVKDTIKAAGKAISRGLSPKQFYYWHFGNWYSLRLEGNQVVERNEGMKRPDEGEFVKGGRNRAKAVAKTWWGKEADSPIRGSGVDEEPRGELEKYDGDESLDGEYRSPEISPRWSGISPRFERLD